MAAIVSFRLEPCSVTVVTWMGGACGWSMLYSVAARLPPGVFAILTTIRNSRPATSVPCQVPLISWASSALPDRAARAAIDAIGFLIGNLLSTYDAIRDDGLSIGDRTHGGEKD